MEFLKRLWALLRREPQVKAMIAELEAKRDELVQGANRLRELAQEAEAKAQAALKRAEAHTKDADWAKRIADKFDDLIG